jgi:hypothetical protein
MTQSQRNIAILLGIALAVGVFLYVGYSFYSAIVDHDSMIEKLTRENKAAEAEVKAVLDARPQLNQWKTMSLAPESKGSKEEYRQMLEELIRRHGFALELFPDNQSPTKSLITLPGKNNTKQPIYVGLNYMFRARAPMSKVVSFVEDFQRTAKMHRIRKLTIERQESAKKINDREQVAVTVEVEALIILDADKEKEKLLKKVLQTDPNFVKTEALEVVGGMRRSLISGLPLMAWSLGPWGPYITPLNPPLKPQRDYADIVAPGVVIGAGDFEIPFTPPMPPTIDLLVNRMRFNRFIGLFTEGSSRPEAKLWDSSMNVSLRIRTSGGFNKIPLVQTGPNPYRQNVQSVLLQGVVTKIVDGGLIFRAGFNTTDPVIPNPTWWRYPDDGYFYKLHPLDRAALEKKNQLPSGSPENLLVIGAQKWAERLAKTDYRKIAYDYRNKSFQVMSDNSRGYVYFENKDVVIVGFNGWTLQASRDPVVAADRIYPQPDRIYAIGREHFETLKTDAKVNAKLKNKIKDDDIDRTYVFHEAFWDWLFEDKLVTVENSGSTFYMYHQLIRGDILARKDKMVVVRLPDKYCHCFGDESRKIPARWHEGFFMLHKNEFVQDAILYNAIDEKDLPTVMSPIR